MASFHIWDAGVPQPASLAPSPAAALRPSFSAANRQLPPRPKTIRTRGGRRGRPFRQQSIAPSPTHAAESEREEVRRNAVREATRNQATVELANHPPLRRNPRRDQQLPARYREQAPPTPSPGPFVEPPAFVLPGLRYARTDESAVQTSYEQLPGLCDDLQSNACTHCDALLWKAERPRGKRWFCCGDGRVVVPRIESSQLGNINTPEAQVVEHELLYLQDLMTQRSEQNSKHFLKHVITYNNALSFTSESSGKIDEQWSHCRIQGSIYHNIPTLFPEEGNTPRFVQIYSVDSSQTQLDVRQVHVNDLLDRDVLRSLQALLRRVNPYAAAFVDCAKRFELHPDVTGQVRIHQVDPSHRNRGTHNLPVSNEVATVILGLDDAPGVRLERDIVVQSHGGALMRIPYWHSAYMALRYPVLFPTGEASWHDGISSHGAGLDDPGRLLAYRAMNGNLLPNRIHNHNDALGPDSGRHGEADDDPHVTDEPNGNDAAGPDPAMHRGKGGSNRITLLDMYRCWLQIRSNRFNRLHHAGRLFQHFVVDAYACVELNRLNWIRKNQATIRADTYSGLMDAIHEGHMEAADVGTKVFVLPSSFSGGPRYMKGLMQDALAGWRRMGKSEYFLTFTCNPNWPEILAELAPGMNSNERPDLIARVFNLKLKELFVDLFKRHVLGRVRGYTWVIEYQKRGLPHAHILLIVDSADCINSSAVLDQTIRAELPSETTHGPLRELVLRHMVHQCGKRCLDDVTKKCSKKFPKELRDDSQWRTDGGYPLYRRRNLHPHQPLDENGEPKGDPVEDSHVVPYNAFLLLKYRAHLNLEFCASIKSIQYLFKYIHKGADSADVEVSRSRDPRDASRFSARNAVRDEITEYHSGRWLGAAEACYRMFGFDTHGLKPAVCRLALHAEHRQSLRFDPDQSSLDIHGMLEDPAKTGTMLTAFFALNAKAKSDVDAGRQPSPNPLTMLYVDIPEHYVFKKSTCKWEPRKRGDTIGRIAFVGPKAGDVFYLRLLLNHVKGPTSFANIRTVGGHLHPTFLSACKALSLASNDNEWDEALTESTTQATGTSMRALFVVILKECTPSDAHGLWLRHKDGLSTDCRMLLQRRHPQVLDLALAQGSQAVRDFEHDYALFLIESALKHNASDDVADVLGEYGLPHPTVNFDDVADQSNRYMREEMGYDHSPEDTLQALNGLNVDQRDAANRILDAVDYNGEDFQNGAVFFLNGPGGTGKTMVQNTVMRHLRASGKIALAVASSGIAATLLEGGRTAHSRFKIPLDATATSRSSIKKQSDLADLLRHTALIFWDEAPMQSKYDVSVVDHLLRDIVDNDASSQLPFGGKVVCFCGDWRQTLPVVPRAGRGRVVESTIQRLDMWKIATVLSLRENMRLRDPLLNEEGRLAAAQFAQQLLDVGGGTHQRKLIRSESTVWPHGHIPSNCLNDLFDRLYAGLSSGVDSNAYLAERALLAVTNVRVNMLNDRIGERLPTAWHTLLSTDTTRNEEDMTTYPVEFLNTFDEPGTPPHRLRLKVGMPVMLIRNLDPPRLCNGTRMRLTRIRERSIQGEILSGEFSGSVVDLPRIPLDSKENNPNFPVPIRRLQFPVKPAFAMTVNKSQGQSIKHVGLDLQEHECFSHGQLYVALSRVTNCRNLHVIGPCRPDYVDRQELANVVWPEVLLPDPSVPLAEAMVPTAQSVV